MDLFHLLCILLYVARSTQEYMIPVVERRPEHSLEARSDELLTIFTPQEKVTWASMNTTSPYRWKEIKVRSENKQYVNLELLEPHLVDERVWCQRNAQAYRPTVIAFRFNNEEHFRIAKDQWANRNDMLFTVEGADCFEGPGERSVYE
ncbi:hypothetical protein PRZ48_005811 [Zasmidium cellare]|uniref:Secreted protein n=1 Tax=Zasmidium cellare TaxID=395010 RepID=A0ABR0EMJ9_ZASCE|nr:hypothetical protein PRZ48_005811 [Zasmidium cellare]